MKASWFVGAVSGLAFAFGVSGAALLGQATAWADDAGPESHDAGAVAAPGADRPRSARTASKSVARQQRNDVRPDTRIGVRSAQPAARGMNRVTVSSPVSKDGLTVAPTVDFADGVFFGRLNAVSERGVALDYAVLGGANGGKLTLGSGPGAEPDQQSFTALPYAAWLDGGGRNTEQFQVRVSEVTDFDRVVTGLPVVGAIASSLIGLIQQLPLISTLLAPIVGASVLATVDVRVGSIGSAPVAFTYDVVSFDGTDISTNFFPASGLQAQGAGSTAETVFNAPGLGSPGQTDPYAQWGSSGLDLGVGALRQAGYNAVTWDPRGEFASGGILQLDNPFYEGRDVSALIDFVAASTPAVVDGPGDPTVGMVGGSYGGGIQLVAASTDPRIEVIVPGITWNSLTETLYPDQQFRTLGITLYQGLQATGARVNPEILWGLLTGFLFGRMGESAQAVLTKSGSTALLNQLKAPTMLMQGITDVLVPLQQSLDNIETMIANPWLGRGDVRLIWLCGGHGICFDPVNPGQASTLKTDALSWLEAYLRGNGTAAAAIPTFQWYDQLGGYNSAAELPFEAGFNNLPAITGTSAGGLLGIVGFIGGSGPIDGPLPAALGFATTASNAINVAVAVQEGTQVVGAPHLSFTYRGLGTSSAVFAQVVDESTGRVLGNMVTPVPVTLDGRLRTASIDLADIAYTYGGQSKPGQLTVQITSSATAFTDPLRFGAIDISDVTVTLPNRDAQP